MTDPHTPDQFAKKLLQQEQILQTPRYQEHRMELELRIQHAERNEKLAGYVVIAALVIALPTMFASGARWFGSPDPTDNGATVLSVAVAVIWYLATITFWLGLASYFSRFRPAVQRAKENLMIESIRELRQEIQELHQMIMPKQPPSES